MLFPFTIRKAEKEQSKLKKLKKILLKYRSKDTPVGLGESAYRERQSVIITNLQEMLSHDIGMLTTVIIGNSSTFLYGNKIITPRGYDRKYSLNTSEQAPALTNG
ncbi:hypothetical protein KHA80_21735 [Anaerobacillus sp. HL2]|nr:hypothetical protein KHA80_21735 [Anaerobacillus sp. HL2]